MIRKDLSSTYIDDLKNFSPELPTELKTYMESYDLKSFWATCLKDDQGIVGFLSIESAEGYLVSKEKQELLEILSSQSTVALRNVELYNTIPSAHFVKSIRENLIQKLVNIREIPKAHILYSSTAMLLLALTLVFLKVPHNINAKIEILPEQQTFFSEVKGVVKDIFVTEGSLVQKGDLLAQIDISDLEIDLLNKLSKKQKSKTEMFKLKDEGNIADFKIKESEYISLDYEVKLLNQKILRSKIFAKSDGIIISEDLDEVNGKPVNFGDEILKMASNDKVIVRFEIPEEDIQFISPGQKVKFKVYGSPNESYTNGIKLLSVSGEGRQINDTDTSKYYMAKAIITTKDHLGLRPGMTGRGKIYSDWIPLGEMMFSKVYNFIVMEVIF
jgi:hypothetical protein